MFKENNSTGFLEDSFQKFKNKKTNKFLETFYITISYIFLNELNLGTKLTDAHKLHYIMATN